MEEPERCFQNDFGINCGRYTMSLIYPSDAGFKPVVYDLNIEKDKKNKSNTQPKLSEIENGLIKATWVKSNVIEGQSFKLEW